MILIALLVVFQGRANETYSGGEGTDFFTKVDNYLNGFLAVGASYNEESDALLPFIVRFDIAGNKVEERVLDDLGFADNTIARGFIEKENGNILLYGESRIGNFNDYQGFVIELNSDLSVTMFRFYPSIFTINDAVAMDDGYLLAGTYESDGRYLKIREDGFPEFHRTIIIHNETVITNILEVNSEEFIIAGYSLRIGASDDGIFVERHHLNSGLIWSQTEATILPFNFFPEADMGNTLALHETSNGEILIAVQRSYKYSTQLFSFEIQNGNSSMTQIEASYLPSNITCLGITESDEIILGGYSNENNPHASLSLITKTGLLLDLKQIDRIESEERFNSMIKTEAGFVLVGAATKPNASLGDDYDAWSLIISDSLQFEANTVNFSISLDTNNDCISDQEPLILDQWRIEVSGNNKKQFVDFNESVESTFLEAGAYEATLLYLGESDIFSTCIPEVSFEVVNNEIPEPIDFVVSERTSNCSKLQVEISHDGMVPCEITNAQILVRNLSHTNSQDERIYIQVDPALQLVEESLPSIAVGDTFYEIPLPDLEAGTQRIINLGFLLNCDVQWGLSHEIIASAESDFCIDNWAGAIFEVEGECRSNEVVFELKNVGNGGPNTSSRCSVLRNDRWLFRDSLIALAKDGPASIISLPKDGSTYRIELDAPPNLEQYGKIIKVIEACGKNPSGIADIHFKDMYPILRKGTYQSYCIASNKFSQENFLSSKVQGLGEDLNFNNRESVSFECSYKNESQFALNKTRVYLHFRSNIKPGSLQLLSYPGQVRISYLHPQYAMVEFEDISIESGKNLQFSFKVTPLEDWLSGTFMNLNAMISINENEMRYLDDVLLRLATNSPMIEDEGYLYDGNLKHFTSRTTERAEDIHKTSDGFLIHGISQFSTGEMFNDVIMIVDKTGQTNQLQLNANSQGTLMTSKSIVFNNNTALYVDSPELGELQVVSKSFSGEVLWDYSRDFGQSGLGISDPILLSNGNAFVFIEISSQGIDTYYSIIFDEQGNIVNENTYNFDFDGGYLGFFITELANGNIVLTDKHATNFTETMFWFLLLNSNGDEIESGTYNYPGRINLFDIAATPNGYVLLGGETLENWDWKNGLFYFDMQGNFNNAQFFDLSTDQFWQAITAKPDSSFFITGKIYLDDTSESDILLLKIKDEGEIEWEKNIGTKYREAGKGIAINGNQIGIIGERTGPAGIYNGNDLIWLVTDLEGDLISNVEQIPHQVSEQIILRPNPARNKLFVDYINHEMPSTWQIINTSGIVVKKGTSSLSPIEIDIQDLNQGAYYFKVCNENGLIQRFIKT